MPIHGLLRMGGAGLPASMHASFANEGSVLTSCQISTVLHADQRTLAMYADAGPTSIMTQHS